MYFVWHDLLKGGGLGLAVVLSSQYSPPTPKVVARVLSDVSIAGWIGVRLAAGWRCWVPIDIQVIGSHNMDFMIVEGLECS